MNEEYFNQIDELLSQGMTEMEVYKSITSSEGFTGSRNQLITDIISKKKRIGSAPASRRFIGAGRSKHSSGSAVYLRFGRTRFGIFLARGSS